MYYFIWPYQISYSFTLNSPNTLIITFSFIFDSDKKTPDSINPNVSWFSGKIFFLKEKIYTRAASSNSSFRQFKKELLKLGAWNC